MFPCSADHEHDWQLYPVDLYSAICDDHTCKVYIYTVACTLNSRLLSRYLGVVAGTLRGFLSPSAMVRSVCNSRDSVLCARVLLLQNCLEKSERNCLTSYLYNAAILASLFLFAGLKGSFRLS